jgi:uncharacterized repeat protein (TIGR03943 family)
VTFLDRSRAAFAIGLLALWMGSTDAMLMYLRPAMRPWVLLAAFGLIALGLYGMLRVHRLESADHDHDHGHDDGPDHAHDDELARPARRSKIGWLMVVPVVVLILFGPQAMGSFAIGRTPNLPPYAFDIAAYASTSGQRVPKLRFADVLDGIKQPGNRAYLADHDIALQGFVSVTGVDGPGSFVLTRFLISCCAADAQPLSVTVIGASSIPDKNHWADVTVRFDSSASTPTAKYGPVMHAVSIRTISAPSGPYESLR